MDRSSLSGVSYPGITIEIKILPGFTGAVQRGSGHPEDALSTFLARQFYTGKIDALNVQRALEKAVAESPESFPPETVETGLKAIGYRLALGGGAPLPLEG
jgi:hypothetical protein